MNRSQSYRGLAAQNGEDMPTDMARASSQPFLSGDTSPRTNTSDLRRRVVQLNRELEQERIYAKQVKRERSVEVRQAREDEQRKAGVMQSELRSKMHREKVNELAALKEQMHKDKEKEIVQIIRQKDDALRIAQHGWSKERDELRQKIRSELWSEAREEAKKEFDKERTRLEQEIVDLRYQKKELEESLKIVQEADKRKADEFRRIHYEHESEMDKFKKNSWQESRRQMSEIRQLLNIIEQLEKKLGLEAGHSMRLRMEKDNLYEELRKTQTFDSWSMQMSAPIKTDDDSKASASLDSRQGSQDLRNLQRKNVELSSLVKKLDEKNQQLATKNAELAAALEKLERESKERNKRTEKKNSELLQNNKRLEGRNKMLLDEVNLLKRKPMSGSLSRIPKPRGQTDGEDDVTSLRAQLREQTRNIADLKQSLMDKDRRIEMLKERKKNKSKKMQAHSSQSADSLSPPPDDDAASVHSDVSDLSEQSEPGDFDNKRVKKLTKELLALERAYALLQAQTGNIVDSEREELERQQLQSDLIQSQARIHELERMLSNSDQVGSGGITELQMDNKALYQKLVQAENDRDKYQAELAKHEEDLSELRDQKDLLEFELEEMSQLSAMGSEDGEARKSFVGSVAEGAEQVDSSGSLSFEEIKSALEQIENEKATFLSSKDRRALQEARSMLDSLSQRNKHQDITESALRNKIRDLEEGNTGAAKKNQQRRQSVCDNETMTDLGGTELEEIELRQKEYSEIIHSQLVGQEKHASVSREDNVCMTDLTRGDVDKMENVYLEYHDKLPYIEQWIAQSLSGKKESGVLSEASNGVDVKTLDQGCMTDLVWQELLDLENTYREYLEQMLDEQSEKGTNRSTNFVEKFEQECMTDMNANQLEYLERLETTRSEGVIGGKKMENKSVETELTTVDLNYFEEVEAVHNECLLQQEKEVEEDYTREGFSKVAAETSDKGVITDLTTSDLEYLEEVETVHQDCLENQGTSSEAVERVSKEVETELRFSDLEYYEEVDEVHRDCLVRQAEYEARTVTEKDDKGTTTELTIPDLQYFEEVNEVHQECLVKTVPETDDKGTTTELTIPDLQYFEEVNEVHQECLVRQSEEEAKTDPETDDKGTTTELTIPDLQYFEEVNEVHQECLVRQSEEEAKTDPETDDKGTTTELTIPDLQYFEEVNEVHQECLVRQSEEEAKTDPETDDKGTTTELTIPDLQYYEEVDEVHQECLVRQEEQDVNSSLSNVVEKDDKGVGTDLTLPDLEYWEEVENVHLGCLEDRETPASNAVETEHKETATELLLVDLQHLEEVETVHQGCLETRENRDDAAELKTHVEKDNKNTMTEMTSVVLSYLEELPDAYKEKVEEFEELKRFISTEKNGKELNRTALYDQCTLTDLTLMDLRDLEDIADARGEGSNSSKRGFTDQVVEEEVRGETMDSLRAELQTFPEIEVDAESLEFSGSDSEYLDHNAGLEREGGVQRSETGTMTELTQDDLFDLEEEVEVLHRKKAGFPKETMTELTQEYLEELEDLHEAELSRDAPNMENAEVMTEMTTADLEYLEEAEGVYRSLSETADLTKLLEGSRDSEDKEVITEIAGSEEKQRNVRSGLVGPAEQEEKSTATELSLLDIGDLEDAASETRLRGKSDEAREIAEQNTTLDLHSELREFVEFDEPAVDALNIAREDQGIMTDLTLSDLEHFEPGSSTDQSYDSYHRAKTSIDQSDGLYRGTDRNDAMHKGAAADSHDVSVQCDLQGVLTLMEELHQEAEGPGVDMPAWYVSALKMTREDAGFGHVHVVLRNKEGGGLGAEVEPLRPSLDRRHSSNVSINLTRPVVMKCRASSDVVESDGDLEPPGLPDSAPPGQGPLVDSDVISLTDSSLDDVIDFEPRERQESAVDKFDKFLKHREDSELRLRLELIDSDEESSRLVEAGDVIDGASTPAENSVKKFDRFLKNRKESELDSLLQLEEKLDSEDDTGHEKEHDQSVEELQIENALLKEKMMELEEAMAMSPDMADDEIELLQLKLEQLKEAELTIGNLTESNMALLERISKFQVDETGLLQNLGSQKSTRDNWSEMDPSLTLSKARLKLVSQAAGFTPSEVDDLQAPTISHASTPLWSPRATGDENDQSVQVTPPVAHVTSQQIQTEVIPQEKFSSQKSTRDNWSEMDSSLRLGKARLMLVSRLAGLTTSEVDDLQASTISHASTPFWSPRDTVDESEQGVQVSPPVPSVTNQQIQTTDDNTMPETIPHNDQGVQVTPPVTRVTSQEIQTSDDLLKLVQLSHDGLMPDHLTQELEKLKQDKRELYDELLELRRKAQVAAEERPTKKLSHESTQTKDDLNPADVTWPVYVTAPGPRAVEEYVISEVTSEVASEPFELESLLEEVDSSRRTREDEDEEGERWLREFVFRPQEKHVIPCDMISEDEPESEIMSSRRSEDSSADVVWRLQLLESVPDAFNEVPDSGRTRTDTGLSVDLNFDDSHSLPPPPESSPPPLPSEPPPDFSTTKLDPELEAMLATESSPPRNSAALRASSRQRSHPESLRTLEEEVEDLLAEDAHAPFTEAAPAVEEDMVSIKEDPSEYGAPPMPGMDTSFWRPPGLKTEDTSGRPNSRPASQPLFKKAPPPTLPKPVRTRFPQSSPSSDLLSMTSPARLSSAQSREEPDGKGRPPRGIVRARANSLNRGEVDALNDKVGFLEKQLKNKENVLRSMKAEATDLETKSLLERRDREVQILEDDVAFLKRENQKKERELLAKIGEINKKNYEIEQWKAQANNSDRQRERMETAYTTLQEQLQRLQGADVKVAQLQTKYSSLEKTNLELNEKVKRLGKTEKEFSKLEENIQTLQNHLQDMESVEKDRDALTQKLKVLENQRDDLLNKGRQVEAERNDFLRNNKIMEMQREDLEDKYQVLLENNVSLKAKLSDLEQELKEARTKQHDSQHERNYAQAQLGKLETNRDGLQQRLAAVTQERNSLVNKVTELEDLNREHVKLEGGIQALKLKMAELTREKDEAEMEIPSLKAKMSLLKRVCKEKDGRIDSLTEEIRELRHSIATSALDDLSKIRSNGYSPDALIKMSGKKKRERKPPKEALVDNDVVLTPQSTDYSKFKASPPGSSQAQLFVALFDYDPFKSCTTGHPEKELKLKEGDYLTVFGDMDLNGCYEADLNGVRGLVPSLYVEEVEEESGSLEVPKFKLHHIPKRKRTQASVLESTPRSYSKSDSMSSGSSTTSARSFKGSESQKQCFVALCDYSPYQSCTTGRPELELTLKEGDILTATGDVDTNGFYRAEMNGQAGLVPAHIIEEVSSSSYLHSSRSTAPEQILGMLDNIRVPARDFATHTRERPPNVTPNKVANGYINGDVMRHNHVPQPTSPQMTSFQVSPQLSPQLSQSMPTPHFRHVVATPPQQFAPAATIQSPAASQQLVPAVTSYQPLPQVTSQDALVVSRSRSRKNGPPRPPGRFRALRPVNEDSVLLGWSLPDMDELGRSNGVVVRGYKIRTDGDFKMNVTSAYMAKALVEGLDLRNPIQFSIQTVAEDESVSQPVTATFADTTSVRSPVYRAEDSGDEDYRTFVALFNYDPFKSSPNPNPASELRFREGDILRVLDTSRKDGFYLGQLKGKKGLIPSNFVEEVAVASSRRSRSRNQRPSKKPTRTSPMSTRSSPSPRGRRAPVPSQSSRPSGKRKVMTALYDYNPEEQSPQDNPDSELAFNKGQIIKVFGDMNADGFYQAELSGHFGLVPASFLVEESDSGMESGGRVRRLDRKDKLRRKLDTEDETV